MNNKAPRYDRCGARTEKRGVCKEKRGVCTDRCSIRRPWISAVCGCAWLMMCAPALAQSDNPAGAKDNDTIQVAMYVKIDRAYYKGDSIPNITLHEFYKTPPPTFKNERQRQRYNKLVRDVRYVFPYAKLTRQILVETYDYLQTLPNEKAKQAHIKAVERGLKEQYEPTVRKITKKQGKLLVKLIDRECGQTSYEMIKAFVGTFRANMYNAISFLFGNNLRKHYDPEGDDKEIEMIVRKVESGQL